MLRCGAQPWLCPEGKNSSGSGQANRSTLGMFFDGEQQTRNALEGILRSLGTKILIGSLKRLIHDERRECF